MTDREYIIRKAILQCLFAADPYLILRDHLEAEVSMKVPRLRATEFDDALSGEDSARRITSVSGDRGVQYKINANGKAWLSEQAI